MTTGRDKIEFARRSMPALAAAADDVGRSGSLKGVRVGVALTLEPKTACLAEALAGAGAEVAVFGSGHSTKPEVVAALVDAGISVFAEAGVPSERVATLRDAFIDTRIELLADDGAAITRRIHTDRRDVLGDLGGVAEETTSGVLPLRVMEGEGVLEVPVVAVNDARTKLLFDNVYGTGQSVVMAVLDATGIHLPGRRVLVVGYGRVGKGIATVARAMGGKVEVTEIDPVAALAAHHDGFELTTLAESLPSAELVITATGIGHTLTARDATGMADGAVVAVGGAGPPELDLTIGPELSWGDRLSPVVQRLLTPRGSVLVVAGGYCANTTAGEGNPIEVMDLSLALQLRALDYLATTELAPGVHLLPEAIDARVARDQLAAIGAQLETPSREQITAARRWQN